MQKNKKCLYFAFLRLKYDSPMSRLNAKSYACIHQPMLNVLCLVLVFEIEDPIVIQPITCEGYFWALQRSQSYPFFVENVWINYLIIFGLRYSFAWAKREGPWSYSLYYIAWIGLETPTL